MGLFDMKGGLQDFILNHYIPEYRKLTARLYLHPLEKLRLKNNFLSASKKLLFAFVWQEKTFKLPFIFGPAVNSLGSESIQVVNGVANILNDFTFYEKNFQKGIGIYPGDLGCNRKLPHAKWHVQSAVGLLDLVYLCDNINAITAPLAG